MAATKPSSGLGEFLGEFLGTMVLIALGDGVWQVYGMKLEADKLTLSGGDLEKPVTLRRVGPPTARADSVAIPAAPPATERAWD